VKNESDGVLIEAQKHVNCFNQSFKCFATHLAVKADR